MSCICRKAPEDEDLDENEEQYELGDDEMFHYGQDAAGRPKLYALTDQPGGDRMSDLRRERLLERDMWDFIREMIAFLIFLWIVLVLTYASRSSMSSVYTYELRDLYLGNDNNPIRPSFEAVSPYLLRTTF